MYSLEQLGGIASLYSCYKLDDDNDLSEFIIKYIDFNNIELIDLVLFITANMGLIKVISYMKDNMGNVRKEIKKLIKVTEKEMLLNEHLRQLILEMNNNNFKGIYDITERNTVKWDLLDNIYLEIVLGGHGGDDLIIINYINPKGKKQVDYDCLSTDTIEELIIVLKEYNNSKIIVKEKGIFKKKYVLDFDRS